MGAAPHSCGLSDATPVAVHRSAGDLRGAIQAAPIVFFRLSSTPHRSPGPIRQRLCLPPEPLGDVRVAVMLGGGIGLGAVMAVALQMLQPTPMRALLRELVLSAAVMPMVQVADAEPSQLKWVP